MPLRYMPWQKFRLGTNHRYHHLSQLRLMEYGEDYFPTLERAIAHAKTAVYLEVYIFANDSIGQRISCALCDAAKRGLDVKVIVDWVGSRHLSFMNDWIEAGVQFHYYNPKWFGPFGLSRTHRKIVVIDHQEAFVGGINICDDWQTSEGVRLQNPRWDFAVQLNHEIALEVDSTFLWQWHRTKEVQLSPEGIKESIQERIQSFQYFHNNPSETGKQDKLLDPVGVFIARDNLHQRRTIERAYLQAIGKATEEIYLVNPYFLPGRRLRTALAAAARRGVRVKLLIGRGEFKWLDAAVSALYGALLKSGVEIYEYTADHMHAKLLVADRHWFTLGSSNCDPLSFLVNHEANVMIFDREHADWLISRIEEAIQKRGRAVEMEQYIKRPLLKKLTQWIAYMMSRIMTRLYVFGSYDKKL